MYFCINYSNMIESITIKNFMCFKKETEISFVASNKEKSEEDLFWFNEINNKRILRLVILSGLNGSGKSAALEAIRRLCLIATLRSVLDIDPVFASEGFKYDEETINQPSEVGLIYYIGNNRYEYKLNMGDEDLYEEELKLMNGRPSLLFRRTCENGKVNIKFGNDLKISKSKRDLIKKWTRSNESVLSVAGDLLKEHDVLSENYLFFDIMSSHIKISPIPSYSIYNLLCERYNYHIDETKKSFVLSALNGIGTGIVDYHFEDFNSDALFIEPKEVQQYCINQFEKKKKYLHLDIDYNINGQIYGIRSYNNPQGIIDIIQFFAHFYDLFLDKGVATFDDFGKGIHPKLISFVLKTYLCLSSDCQILVATNNTSILDLDFMRRDALRLVEKSVDGTATIRRFPYLHKTMSLFRAYNKEIGSSIDIIMEENNFNKHMEPLKEIMEPFGVGIDSETYKKKYLDQ